MGAAEEARGLASSAARPRLLVRRPRRRQLGDRDRPEQAGRRRVAAADPARGPAARQRGDPVDRGLVDPPIPPGYRSASGPARRAEPGPRVRPQPGRPDRDQRLRVGPDLGDGADPHPVARRDRPRGAPGPGDRSPVTPGVRRPGRGTWNPARRRGDRRRRRQPRRGPLLCRLQRRHATVDRRRPRRRSAW